MTKCFIMYVPYCEIYCCCDLKFNCKTQQWMTSVSVSFLELYATLHLGKTFRNFNELYNGSDGSMHSSKWLRNSGVNWERGRLTPQRKWKATVVTVVKVFQTLPSSEWCEIYISNKYINLLSAEDNSVYQDLLAVLIEQVGVFFMSI